MENAVVKKTITEILSERKCTEIDFHDIDKNSFTVSFNCEELLSFNNELNGWNYSGIQLDPTGKREYKIDFFRETL